MSIQNCIPFSPNAYTTELAGASLGQVFIDPSTGKEYVLVQVDDDLINDELRDGECCGYVENANFIVGNKAANYENTTHPKAAGVVNTDSTHDIPESTTSVTYYCLLLTKGKKTSVKTDGGGDIAKGDTVILDETVNGCVDLILITEDLNGNKMGQINNSKIGIAIADDSATAVDVMVDVCR